MSEQATQPAKTVEPDALELAPGFEHENLEGWIPELASEEELRVALEKAFDYRGDIKLTLKDGRVIEGYVFDRRTAATLAESLVRVIPAKERSKVAVSYAEIAALAFTGRDTAAGKSFEAWMKKYREKKAAGEKGIGIEPEKLD
jgi:aminoglycoside N3'-acetyltransferase